MKGKSNTDCLPRVVDYLKVGKTNAIKQADLCRMMHCNPDELKAAVQRFRRTNTEPTLFICSDTCGYYIAKDRAEIRRFVTILRKQALSRLETIRAGKRMLDAIEGQESVDEVEVW